MPLSATSEPPFSHLGRRGNKSLDPVHQKGFFPFFPGETWTPSVNLYETELAYLVCVDLAGVDKEKIDVEVLDNQLTLKGNREIPLHAAVAISEETTGRKPRVHLMEIDHGAFCRQVELPVDVMRDQITAQYVNGILWIEIPKS